MKVILKQLAQLLGALIVLYGGLLAISLLLAPCALTREPLDAARAASTLFLTEPKYVFLTRTRLDTVTDKAVLLGGSNMLVGFKRAEVQALVPEVEVHNLAVGGSNITQVGQIIELIREVQSFEARRHNTYVLGLWYGLFAADQARWYTAERQAGDTDIDIERYRYGFYRRTAAGAVPVLPPRYLDVGRVLIHPYLVLERTARNMTGGLRGFMAAKPPTLTDGQRNAVVLSDAEKQTYLAFWRDYTGSATTLGDAPVQLLQHMVEGILTEQGRVILVDMPIPPWHARGSTLCADYRRRVDALLARLRLREGVTVLSMNDAGSDDDFSDEVHPKPRVTPSWARRLAAVLSAQARGAPVSDARARAGAGPESMNATQLTNEGPRGPEGPP